MTETEKSVIRILGDTLYTVEFLEEWINRDDNVFINAPAALQSMGAKGYYLAVQRMLQAVPQWDGKGEEYEIDEICLKERMSHGGTKIKI